MLMHGDMKITSFGFIELVEAFLKDALSAPPLGGGAWEFQRSVNFSDRTGSLQILITHSAAATKTKVSIQARQTGSQKDYSIQGWTEIPDANKKTVFVLKESNPVRVEEEVFDIVDRLLASIPERDESVAIERPAPLPKPSFEPLIPEIQKAPEEPSAESFDSNQSFIDSLLSSNTESPAEAKPSEESAESAESAQALVDSLMSPDNFGEPPVEEKTAEAPVEETPAPEAAAPKAKATKAKKSAK
jgi:hypothetical protein